LRFLRSLLRLQLEAGGHEVLEAPDGLAGLRLHQERPTDVILCDLLMPEKEGLETIRELRRAAPARVVAMSGDGPPLAALDPAGLLRTARLLGADAALAKPFSGLELLLALGQGQGTDAQTP
jgi:CheY-like chemotaxis protein